MEVGVTALRAELKRWLEEARSGDEVIVTDRGLPVARLTGIDVAPILEQLELEGAIRLPRGSPRPSATGRSRVAASRSVSELITDQRD